MPTHRGIVIHTLLTYRGQIGSTTGTRERRGRARRRIVTNVTGKSVCRGSPLVARSRLREFEPLPGYFVQLAFDLGIVGERGLHFGLASPGAVLVKF
jgi:hypothetical protein